MNARNAMRARTMFPHGGAVHSRTVAMAIGT